MRYLYDPVSRPLGRRRPAGDAPVDPWASSRDFDAPRGRDPDFVAKLRDVVGLYVDPPAHAIVLSVDEKSQIQALDRTQPGLPMKKGRLGTMTHDYKRHGTTTLFDPPSTCSRARSSGAACSATATRSSSACLIRHRGRYPGRQGRSM